MACNLKHNVETAINKASKKSSSLLSSHSLTPHIIPSHKTCAPPSHLPTRYPTHYCLSQLTQMDLVAYPECQQFMAILDLGKEEHSRGKSPLKKNALPAALQPSIKRGIEFEGICRCHKSQCKLYRQVLTTTHISIFAQNSLYSIIESRCQFVVY